MSKKPSITQRVLEQYREQYGCDYKEFWKGIQANCDHADEALERILNRYPYMRDNADWHDIAALINGIRMMSFELEPDKEKPPTAATEDGQTGKSLENEYPSLF